MSNEYLNVLSGDPAASCVSCASDYKIMDFVSGS